MTRRSPGDGTLFKRSRDGLWVGRAVIDGRLKQVTSNDRKVAERKVAERKAREQSA